MSMLTQAEPAKKRSKLVLPEPQISDQDMQQVIKLGKASDFAKDVAAESGTGTTDALLGDYSITPQIAATPRTPAVFTDRIMQEAQAIIALTHVETPLKGGANTQVHETDFSSALPTPMAIATPNTVLATPLQRNADGTMTPGFQTPANRPNDKGEFTPAVTRDKLNINVDEFTAETPIALKNYRKQLKESLREKLSTLPTPKNDYEIVVPEDVAEDETDSGIEPMIEDQDDADTRVVAEGDARKAAELARRSQVIQNDLPRPLDINKTILRPSSDMVGLTDLQQAEELIKQEMIAMLHYDAMMNPTVSGVAQQDKKRLQQAQDYIKQSTYDQLDDEDLEAAKELLKEEMQVVKNGMAHGDLSLENYSQVWEECLSQVLYLPNQSRYTRANLASKKDRFESAERKLEQNRALMAKDARRCGKIEKKLKILTGGYQARAQAITQQLHDTFEQIEQTATSLESFKHLEIQEDVAIPRRLEVSICLLGAVSLTSDAIEYALIMNSIYCIAVINSRCSATNEP